MLVKRVLIAASASLAGLLVLACAWSLASAAAAQIVLTCNNDGITDGSPIPAGATSVVTCETTKVNLSSFTNFTVDYVGIDGQGSNNKVIINGIEATLNVNNAHGLLDFMDVAFSPYAGAMGGGGTSPNFSTYGGTQSPNISLDKNTIFSWISALNLGLGPPTNITFEAQVFVTNTDTSHQFAYDTLRVIVDTF
jgi:hypothetical protein